MKKIIAISALCALLLCGCGKEAAQQPEDITTAPVETTMEVPEQIVSAEESPLTGNWVATMDKGAFAASIYYLRAGHSEDEVRQWVDDIEGVSYPLQVTITMDEEGNYQYAMQADTELTGFKTFVETLHAALDDEDLTQEDLEEQLVSMQLDKVFLMGAEEAGQWEQNDRGLVLSGWCTVQFEIVDGNMVWNQCDDQDLDENLPLTFQKK